MKQERAMTERVTDVVLSNGAAVHVYGTAEQLRTKFEAAMAANTVFLDVDIEGYGKEKRVRATLNIFQVAMIMRDHEQHNGPDEQTIVTDLGHASL